MSDYNWPLCGVRRLWDQWHPQTLREEGTLPLCKHSTHLDVHPNVFLLLQDLTGGQGSLGNSLIVLQTKQHWREGERERERRERFNRQERATVRRSLPPKTLRTSFAYTDPGVSQDAVDIQPHLGLCFQKLLYQILGCKVGERRNYYISKRRSFPKNRLFVVNCILEVQFKTIPTPIDLAN